MSVEIRIVDSQKDLKTFVKVPFGLYKGHEYWVPPLIKEELEIFDPQKNPAFEKAECRLFLAYKEGKVAGRIAAILSHAANEKFNTRNMRFSWFDSIDDYEVSSALFKAVEDWAKEKNMITLSGPHGFTDLDPEGMLVEGYDQLPTIAVFYNYPYYNTLVEKYGFEKEIDFVEFKCMVPHKEGISPKLVNLADRIAERSGISLIHFRDRKHVMEHAEEIFRLIDETFAENFGVVPLTENQIRYYINKYIPVVHMSYIKAVCDKDNNMIGFMISLPSLSRAFQKAKGRLFPFGWFHIMRAMKKVEILDFYLAGIKDKYRGLGADLLMVLEISKAALENGVKSSESNPELETNKKIQAQWKHFNPELHKRRRIYKKEIH